MKKWIAAASISLAMLGISCFAGCCFGGGFSISDFATYIKDTNTVSKFENGFDIEVEDADGVYLTGKVLSEDKISVNVYDVSYYINGDGYVYLSDDTSKIKMTELDFELDETFGIVADIIDSVSEFLSDLKYTILDNASYYDRVSKKEVDGAQTYTLDDNFYDNSSYETFDYRQIYMLTYKDNKLVEYVDCVIGEKTNKHDQTITLTAATQDIVFPDFGEFTEYMDAEAFEDFIMGAAVENDMTNYNFSFEYQNNVSIVGEYHQTQEGNLLKLNYFENNNLKWEAYLVGDVVYVNDVDSAYAGKKYSFDFNTQDTYFANIVGYLQDAMRYAQNYENKILRDFADNQYEIDQITKNSNGDMVEIGIEKHKTYGDDTAEFKYTYENNKLSKVEISYIFSSVSRQSLVATACENTSFDLPEDLNSYTQVESSQELKNA